MPAPQARKQSTIPLQESAPPAHWPALLQAVPAAQTPHTPPQPLGPQFWPAQSGMHRSTHCPPSQLSAAGQFPHEPPHPSVPQFRPSQFGSHGGAGSQLPCTHSIPGSHSPQTPPHPLGPQFFSVPSDSLQLGTQATMHCPPSHAVPAGQSPQVPPHPLSPHSALLQSGTQGIPSSLLGALSVDASESIAVRLSSGALLSGEGVLSLRSAASGNCGRSIAEPVLPSSEQPLPTRRHRSRIRRAYCSRFITVA